MPETPARRGASIASEAAMTGAGLTLAVMPLALWVAPDILTFKLVLLACGVACWTVVLLAHLRPAAPPPPGHRPGPLHELPVETIERLQNRGELDRRR